MAALTFPQRTLAHVLPPNASDYLRNMAAGGADRMLDVDAEEIRHLWNPRLCPERLLPYLAWALSVDIWDTSWDVEKKRRVCANAFLDHQRKGTLATIQQYLGYRNSAIDKLITPPARCFSVQGMTDAQREAYIDGLTQIRLYPFETGETAPIGRAFMSRTTDVQDALSFYRSFYGACFMQKSKGRTFYGLRATVAVPGRDEVPATVDYPETYDNPNPVNTIRVSTLGSKRLFMGHAAYGHGFMQTSYGGAGVIQVKLSDSGVMQFAALNGGTLQDVRPARVYETRTAPKSRMFMGRDYLGNNGAYMLHSNASRLIYDRFALVDASAPVNLQPGRSFMGHARFGISPYTAEMRVEVPMYRTKIRFGIGRGQYMRGYIKATDFTPLNNCLDAIGSGRSLRDTVLVDTAIFQTVQLGMGLKLGSYKLNELVRRT